MMVKDFVKGDGRIIGTDYGFPGNGGEGGI